MALPFVCKRGRCPKTVDLRFILEESVDDLTILRREQQVLDVEGSTTYARLKDIARSHLKVRGEIELLLLDDDDEYPTELGLDDNSAISKALSGNSSMQVKHFGHFEEDSPSPSSRHASCTASSHSRSFQHHRRSRPDIAESVDADQLYDLFWDEALALSLKLSKDPYSIATERQDDQFGGAIQGSCSQFSSDDGRSACTAICLYAAARFLRQMDDAPRCLTPDLIDSTIQMGIFLYQDLIIQQEHTSVHELWTQQAFRDIVPSLDRADAICGCTSHREFARCLEGAAHFASSQGETSVALIITKPPETILMLCKNVKQGAPWFLFDSHGKSSDRKKRAYILQLETMDDAANVLFDLFPQVDGLEGESLHAQQVNMFEAHPIILKEKKTIRNRNIPTKNSRIDSKLVCPSVDPHRRASKTFEEVEMFRDMITGDIFADPVFCDKGHTHERSCIEHHFRSRREQKAEDDRRHLNQGSTSADGDSCHRSTNFDPTCPFTGEPISEILIPNDQCDRLVVSLVESGVISLDTEELQSWTERRRDKSKRVIEERAAAAQKRPEAASQRETSTPFEHTAATGQTVLLSRPCQPGANENVDLGVSVALCPISFERSRSTSPSLRCSNACCRSRLEGGIRGSCARCAQTICADCLIFEVNEATPQSSDSSERTHLICPDCVLQIIDVLRSSNEEEQEAKARSMTEVADAFFEQLATRKGDLQTQAVRHKKQQEFSTTSQRLACQRRGLEQDKESLRTQIQTSKKQAEAARLDEGNTAGLSCRTPRENELLVKIADLECEYNAIDWSNEDNILRYSMIEHELNESIMELTTIQSAQATPTREPVVRSIPEVELAAECEAVMRAHDELEAQGPTNETDEEFTIRLSDLFSQYDKLSLELVLLREESGADKTPARRLKLPPTETRTEKGDVSTLDALAANAIASDLLTIGKIDIGSGGLPLDLVYPSSRMRNQVLQLLNDLQGQQLELERELDDHYREQQIQLEAHVDALQDEIVVMRREVSDAQTIALEEERLRQERIRRREEAEQQRVLQEQRRAAEQRRLQLERERLEQSRRQQEEQTRQSLRGHDLRCCGQCGFGPFTKFACNDMAAHNDKIFAMDKNGRRRERGSNECPKCGWFDSQWQNWPKYRM